MDERSLEEILTDYCIDGWFLFPIRAETKIPAIKNNLNDASNDVNQLLKWAKKFPGCSWGVSLAKSGKVAVDIDTKHGGIEYWNALIGEHGEPETLKQKSGSGGLHYIFKAEAGKRYRGKLRKDRVAKSGIDVKHNGYVVVYPSLHPRTKNQYTWVNYGQPIPIAPDWIKAFIEKDGSLQGKASPLYKIGDGFFEHIVTQLKDKPFGYEDWNKAGMALHAWDSSQKGLDLFLELSSGVNHMPGDDEKARAKWDSYRSGGGVNPGSLVFLAREHGCQIKNPLFWEDKETLGEINTKAIEKEMDEVPEWIEDDRGRLVTVHADFLVEQFNQMGFSVLTGDGEGQVFKSWVDNQGITHVRGLSMENFKTSVKAYHYKIYLTLASGVKKAKLIPAFEVWLTSKHRVTYSNIVFRKNASADELNLGGAIPCEPIKGDVKLFQYLCNEILSDGDLPKGHWLMQWAADLVQNPWRKCSVVPVLIGKQGTGKNLFCETILGKILGPYFIKVMSSRILTEKFNREQSQKFLTFIDESTWRGNKEQSDILKSLTGSPTMTVEEKFGGRFTIENPSRYIVASNSVEAVNIETSNRRFLIFELSEKHIQDAAFFDEIFSAIQEKKLVNNIYNFLLNYDLKGFNPHVFPRHLDKQGIQSKLKSYGPVAQFWWELLIEDPQKIFLRGRYIPKGHVFELYLESMKKINHWDRGKNLKTFWDETKDIFKHLREPKRDTRIWHGDNGSSNRPRVFITTPIEMAKSLCALFNMAVPKDFDDLEFLAETELSEIGPALPKSENRAGPKSLNLDN